VKHSKVKDEPIKDLLGNVVSYLVEHVLDRYYGGDESTIPTVEYLSCPPPTLPSVLPLGIQRRVAVDHTTYLLSKDVPDAAAWLETLAGSQLNWLRAFLTSTTIVQGKS
jgi:fatty acid synthase subunit alpha, fungi type